jgi:hypothetical protein
MRQLPELPFCGVAQTSQRRVSRGQLPLLPVLALFQSMMEERQSLGLPLCAIYGLAVQSA